MGISIEGFVQGAKLCHVSTWIYVAVLLCAIQSCVLVIVVHRA